MLEKLNYKILPKILLGTYYKATKVYVVLTIITTF